MPWNEHEKRLHVHAHAAMTSAYVMATYSG